VTSPQKDLTSRHNYLTSRHYYMTSRHNYLTSGGQKFEWTNLVLSFVKPDKLWTKLPHWSLTRLCMACDIFRIFITTCIWYTVKYAVNKQNKESKIKRIKNNNNNKKTSVTRCVPNWHFTTFLLSWHDNR
jgi:hypothetical protein